MQDFEQKDVQEVAAGNLHADHLGRVIELTGYRGGQLVGELIGISHAGRYAGCHTDLTVEWDRDQSIVVRRRTEEPVSLRPPLPEPEGHIYVP